MSKQHLINSRSTRTIRDSKQQEGRKRAFGGQFATKGKGAVSLTSGKQVEYLGVSGMMTRSTLHASDSGAELARVESVRCEDGDRAVGHPKATADQYLQACGGFFSYLSKMSKTK